MCIYIDVYGNAKVCTWDGINIYNSTGWGLTGQTALLRGGPGDAGASWSI